MLDLFIYLRVSRRVELDNGWFESCFKDRWRKIGLETRQALFCCDFKNNHII